MSHPTVLTVFVASPGDVKEERNGLERVIAILNRTVAKERGIVLELVRWEKNVRPAVGARPQAVVTRQTGPMRQHAMFIGIMWARFGTPTGLVESGTEEEFHAAVAAREEFGQPEIMFYFSNRPTSQVSVEKAEQALKVAKFREQVQKLGIIWEFDDPADFERKVYDHLDMWLRSFTQQAPTPPDQRVPDEPGPVSAVQDRPRVEDSGMWVLLGQSFLLATEVTEKGGSTIELRLPAKSSVDDSAVRTVARLAGPVPFAHGSDAAIVEVTQADRNSGPDGAVWSVNLLVKDALDTASYSDMGTTGYSADAIAELRVRRALLNEKPVRRGGNAFLDMGSDVLLMALISGMNSPLKVERGAIPYLAENIDPNAPTFLELARLYAILQIRASHAVGSVDYLILEREGPDSVKVEFRGQRPRTYSNVEPPTITVVGTCAIRD